MPWGLEVGRSVRCVPARRHRRRNAPWTGIGWPLNSFARLSLRASGGTFEATFHHHALSVDGAESRMHPIQLVHRIHDLRRYRHPRRPSLKTAAISVSSDARDVAICLLVMCSPLRVASAGLHQFHNRLRRIDRPPSAAMRRHGRNHSRSTEPSLLSDGIGRYLGNRSRSCRGSRRTPWPELVAHQRHTCLPSACEYAVTEMRMPYSPPALPMNTMRFQASGAIVSLNPMLHQHFGWRSNHRL